jgi:hypothetical protein
MRSHTDMDLATKSRYSTPEQRHHRYRSYFFHHLSLRHGRVCASRGTLFLPERLSGLEDQNDNERAHNRLGPTKRAGSSLNVRHEYVPLNFDNSVR